MPHPLQYGDPPQLGPFWLQGRLHAGEAGVVFLGHGPGGQPVSVAVLTRGAAFDPAAKDRFVAAIKSGVGVRTAPPVTFADADGPAPWVATPYDPQRPGAERFLEPVIVSGAVGGNLRGPAFQPYWIGQRSPAVPAPPGPPVPTAPPSEEGTETRKALTAGIITLAVLLLLLLLLLGLLYGCRPSDSAPPPVPVPSRSFVPTPPPVPSPTPSPSPSPTRSPSPSPGPTGSPSPEPTEGSDGDGGPV